MPSLIDISAASIVFVHGLGGHPQSTWSTDPHEPKASANTDTPTTTRGVSTLLRRSLESTRPRKKAKLSDNGFVAEEHPQPGSSESSARASGDSVAQKVFWPGDLLPHDVPDVRVLTFGYYSNPGGSSQDNLYTLSKSLLSQVSDERMNSVGGNSASLPTRMILLTLNEAETTSHLRRS